MKKLMTAVFAMCAATALAVDVETVVDANFSVPASVKPAMQKVDRNTAALKSAVETGVTTATANLGTAKTFATNTVDALVRSGVCTSGGAITFAKATRATPTVVGTWVGQPRMSDGTATNSVLYLSACSTAGFTFLSMPPCTNQIYYFAY